VERANIGPRTWAETAYAAEKRVAWIQKVYSPILHKENGRITMMMTTMMVMLETHLGTCFNLSKLANLLV